MTANQIKGKGFKGALRYNLEKVGRGVAEILDHSFSAINEKTILKEIQMVKMLKPNLKKFFYHTSINFPPHENISNEFMKQIANDYLKGNGFDQHQYIMFRHHDSSHPHLHLLVNRIGYDGRVLSDSNDFARSEKVLRALETKYNLTPVVSSKQALKRAATKSEMEMMKRTGTPSHKIQVQKLIERALASKKNITCSQFILALLRLGVIPKFNIAKTGHVSGISYAFNGMVFTGSKLGSEFKWTTIRERIDYDKVRDNQVINKVNSEKAGITNVAISINSKGTGTTRNEDNFIFLKNPFDDLFSRSQGSFVPPLAEGQSDLPIKRKRKRRRPKR
ncbi:relaxase/mobilization nuclease domain-containing protein [Pseudochryseolinea flava]|uniref:Relaxase/mobilization nuclease n=1 Tax=Pseudochryseolinea flava TaxID=2059302 RepID=A0A364Y331_9BACT|nr:relaxase/mobilization nuclease domain-containing protein [Pseudochryseolinea flava]RAW01092.1 relaxase/mobilization nuclease [Pseudochryseolinea flava]